MQPTVGIKNALQEGRAIPRSPAALYRGLTVNAVSMAPITAMQFGVNRALEQFVKGITGELCGKRKRLVALFIPTHQASCTTIARPRPLTCVHYRPSNPESALCAVNDAYYHLDSSLSGKQRTPLCTTLAHL